MSETRLLLRRVSEALETPDLETEGFEAVAREFSERVRQTNDRAEECVMLLGQGRHDEARAVARRSPDFQEEYRLLSAFAPTAEWTDECKERGLSSPPRLLQVEAEEVIRRLYGGKEQVETLLARYRRMSLGRAPLIFRLRTLRALSRLVPSNTGLAEDIREFERERGNELGKLGAKAKAAGDLETLQALLAEARGPDWVTSPPLSVATSLEQAVRPLLESAAKSELEQILAGLHEAHAALDRERAESLLGSYTALAAERPDPDPSASDVESIRHWLKGLQEEDAANARFEADCTSLERSLDDGADGETVRRLYSAVARHEREVPKVLVARVSSRLEASARDESRRFGLRIVIALAVLGLSAAAIFIGWQTLSAQRELDAWKAQIESALERGNLEEAQALVQRLRQEVPGAVGKPGVAALVEKLEQSRKQQETRLAQFEALRGQLEEKLGADGFEALYQRANLLADSLEARNRLEDLRQEHERLLATAQQKRETEFTAAIEAQEARFLVWKTGLTSGTSTLAEGESVLRSALELRSNDFNDSALNSRLVALIASLEALLERTALQAAREQESTAAIERIASQGNQPDRLEQALQAFTTEFPNHALTPDFTQVLKDWSAIRAAAAWQTLVSTWSSLRVDDQDTARRRAEAVGAYLGKFPTSPYAPEARHAKAYLDCAQQALTSEGLRFLPSVSELLESQIVVGLKEINHDGKRYFLLRDAAIQVNALSGRQEVSFKYIVNSELLARTEKFTLPEGARPPRPFSPSQTGFAQVARRAVRDLSQGARWETLYLGLAIDLLKRNKMDPVLQAALSRAFLTFAEGTTPFVGERLGGIRRSLQSLKVDVAWLDPDDGPAKQARRDAKNVLSGIEDLTPLLAEVEAGLDLPLETLSPVGVFLGDPEGFKYSAFTRATGSLLSRAPGGEFRKVGEARPGGPWLDASAVADLPAGTVVFLKKER